MRMEEQHGQSATSTTQRKAKLDIEGRLIQLDEDGCLVNAADWSKAVAEHMAQKDELVLGDDHWLLIDFLHRFYQEFDVAPDLHILSRNLCKDQQNCRWTRAYVKQLFPNGARTACRYAGLPAPLGGCV